jgi:hypothetical protein
LVRTRASTAHTHTHSKERGRKQSNFSHSPPNPRAADDGLCMHQRKATNQIIFEHRGASEFREIVDDLTLRVKLKGIFYTSFVLKEKIC